MTDMVQQQQMMRHHDAEIEGLIGIANDSGVLLNDRHELNVGPGSEIRVRDNRTGLLVAFSSMRADYDQSLAEFIRDFFGQERDGER